MLGVTQSLLQILFLFYVSFVTSGKASGPKASPMQNVAIWPTQYCEDSDNHI